MSKYSKGGRASPWTGLFMSHESHSTLQQGPNVATRSRSGPKSLSSWVEDNCVLMGRILYWNGEICTSQLDSLSPWRSLLRINKGNFLFSLIYFKCQSSHCFSSCAQVLFPVMRGAHWSGERCQELSSAVYSPCDLGHGVWSTWVSFVHL